MRGGYHSDPQYSTSALELASRENSPHSPEAACKLQQELNELFFHSIHKVFDDAVTPPECAVNCQGSVKCFTDDCFAVQTVFNFQKEGDFSLFLFSTFFSS